LRDNTIVLYLTDNGGTGGISVYNAGLRGAKASLYEGGHRAACFLRWPGGGLRPAGDLDVLTQCQDVLPTLVDLCGLTTPAGSSFDGTSLASLLRGKRQPELADRKLVVQYGGLVQSEPVPWDSAVLWNRWRLVHGKELYDIKTDPGQKQDIAGKHPEVVAALRQHYERWWAGVEPSLAKVEAITIGSNRENPARLSSMDWYAPKLVPCAQPFDIRLVGRTEVKEGSLPLGRPTPVMNGPWNVEVAQDGEYEIRLYRWPREADAPLVAGLPAYQGVDGSFPAGIALPIAKARVKIGNTDLSKPVDARAKAVTFEATLRRGKGQLQTWFYDAQGSELCGAFYVEVLRK
jgi:arylsulfatase B